MITCKKSNIYEDLVRDHQNLTEGNFKMEVVVHSESDSEMMYETSEAGAVLYKDASCQATSDLSCEVIVPIMFCTMFSPACEASLQVDLPLKTYITVNVSASASTPPQNIPSKISKRVTKDQRKPRKKIRMLSKSKAISIKSRKTWDEESPERMHSDGQEFDDERMHSDGQEFDDAPPPSPEQDYIDKDPDNSEFSSDNDAAFWKKVEKRSKPKPKRKKPSSLEFPLKYPSHIRSSFKNGKSKRSLASSQITNKGYECEQPSLLREGESKLDKGNSPIMEAEGDDDWITDDEVDEELENIDIEMAFKKEYKERRLPPNTREKNFMCEICGKLYSKHNLLRIHVVRDHKDEDGPKLFPYSCQYCKNVYVKEKQLLIHQKHRSGPCDICGIVLKCSGLFWSHRRDHDCVCHVCNKQFSTRACLYNHIYNIHKEKTVPCPKCDKKFPFESFKNKHVAKAHPEELMPYQCDKCSYSARKQASVKMHQKKVHNAKPPQYTCKDCNSKFVCEASYNTHIENHISRRSIVCHLCSQKFISDEEFQAHMKSVHKPPSNKNSEEKLSSSLCDTEVQYSCGVCSIILGDEKQLTQHMQQFHYVDKIPRDIKVEIEHVEAPEAVHGSSSKVQVMDGGESNPCESERTIKNETMTLSLPTGLDCSDGGSALLMPANVVPPNVNTVNINGLQYHVMRGSQ